MNKLFYIANIRMPTERAHGIQVMHMCSAFSAQGMQVTLLVPTRKTVDEDPFEYYGVAHTFTIEKVPVPDTVRFGKLGFLLESIVFAKRAVAYIRVQSASNPRPSASLVYTREELPFLFLPAGVRALYEAHNLRKGAFFRRLIRQASQIVAISQGVADAVEELPFPKERILVAHDGYDERQFSVNVSKDEVRKALSLPRGRKIAMYIGGFDIWKGVETFCQSASLLTEHGILGVVIGGTEKEVKEYKAKYPHVFFVGERPYRELPVNQQAADVLVIPNSAKARISREFTSPLKLFAHMASGVPIVASDIPSIREVLTENESCFFKSDDIKDLARAITDALSDGKLLLAAKASQKVQEFTWTKRVRNILDFFAETEYKHYPK